MVEVDYHGSHIRIYNVDVTICEDGRLYIDNPNDHSGQYFAFKTSEISTDELMSMRDEVENKWDKGEEDEESDN